MQRQGRFFWREMREGFARFFISQISGLAIDRSEPMDGDAWMGNAP
jgi:hypothetical protein